MATRKKDNSIVSLALWLALATTPMAAMMVSAPLLAQSAPDDPSFPLPQTVENGTTVKIDGSSSLTQINQSLKENFEKQFSGTKVEFATNGTDAALKDLLDGKIDIAAIGRGLTAAEKAQGLEQVRLRREKIAIVVGADNPFKQSLTSKQFARIFRGKITNWSEVGGPNGKIRVIDHPKSSDTRDTFRDYPAFKTADFTTGSNATQLAEDNPAEIIKQLGKDGISYVLANQVSKLPNVRVLQLHQTLPGDAKYPFSQPLVYVYKKNPSLGVAGFLGFTLAPVGQQAIEQARVTQAEAIAANVLQIATQATPAATTSPSATTAGEPFLAPPPTPEPVQNNPIVNRETPFLVLLPVFIIAVGGFLLWWFLGRRPSATEKADSLPESNPSPNSTEDLVTAAAVNANTAYGINELIPEEQPLPHFQSEDTSNSTPFQIYAQTTSDQGTSNLTSEAANGAYKVGEGTISNSENNVGAAALASGAALLAGTEAAVWSAISKKETETQANNQTRNGSVNTGGMPAESDEVAWDIEAPAAVVNTSYPQLPNISEEAYDVELPITEVTNSLPEFADVPNTTYGTSDFEYWDTEVPEDQVEEELQAELEWLESITSTDELPLAEFGEVESDVEASSPEVASFPELPEEALNVVADAAESDIDLSEEVSPALREDITETAPPDFASAAALAAGAGIAAWATTFESDNTVDNVPMSTTGSAYADEESNIVLMPHSFTSVHVCWEISDKYKEALRQQGNSQLVVRLYDVTEIDLSYQSPQFIQQYECEEKATDGLIDIPVSDRNYMAEIGYVTDSDRWVFIARSANVRIFSPVGTDPIIENLPIVDQTALDSVEAETESTVVITPRTPKWAYVSWSISENHQAVARQQSGSQLVVRLYDVTGIDLSYQTPQLVQQYECEEVARDRFVAIPVSDRDYMAEIGYVAEGDRWLLIARSANVRVFSRPHGDFWFVADAELIIHGATQPNTSVTIGGHSIKIKPDGTFHLRLPFSDGLIDYLITVAANGESTRTIHKKFSQETSES